MKITYIFCGMCSSYSVLWRSHTIKQQKHTQKEILKTTGKQHNLQPFLSIFFSPQIIFLVSCMNSVYAVKVRLWPNPFRKQNPYLTHIFFFNRSNHSTGIESRTPLSLRDTNTLHPAILGPEDRSTAATDSFCWTERKGGPLAFTKHLTPVPPCAWLSRVHFSHLALTVLWSRSESHVADVHLPKAAHGQEGEACIKTCFPLSTTSCPSIGH